MRWIALRAWPEPMEAGSRQALACHALGYTPRVTLAPDAVLMEVSGSLRLWGGLARLLADLRARVLADGAVEPAWLQAAPGQTALQALARLRLDLPWRESSRVAVGHLPLAALSAAQPHLAVLERLGCRQWQDLRRLPRAGVARRFGQALLDALDQAYGEQAQSHDWWQLPEVFEDQLHWPDGVEHAEGLLFAARRLLQRLHAWLLARSLGLLALQLRWHMEARRSSVAFETLPLRLSAPTQDMGHVLRLLAEHFSQLRLSAPVQTVALRSLQTAPLRMDSADLLPDAQRQGDSLAQMLERLDARLGRAQVQRWQLADRHVPERMQQCLPALAVHAAAAQLGGPTPHRREGAAPTRSPTRSRGISAAAALAGSTVSLKPGSKARGGDQGPDDALTPTLPERGREKRAGSAPALMGAGWGYGDLLPTWLLPQPQPLRVQGERPCHHGPLTLLVGPQRLEISGWAALTDGQGAVPAENFVMRDYFIARSPQAGLLWIYRERQPRLGGSWFLHGIFA